PDTCCELFALRSTILATYMTLSWWLSNPWVVGLGTGVLSGLFVTWVLSRRKDREYLQRVAIANREVVYAIRIGIPEGVIPPAEVVAALVHSTARRYDVAAGDLYTHVQIAEELIKEVMDSTFLSAARKAEYCTAIAPLSIRQQVVPVARIVGADLDDPLEYRKKRIQELDRTAIIIAGVLTASITTLISVLVFARHFDPSAAAGIRLTAEWLFIGLSIPIFVLFLIVQWSKRVNELRRIRELERRVATAHVEKAN
ncbi:MAG: hypothetical protein WBF42_09360, partial [Terracidiphilus sp.]